jgi:tellurite resistance protein TehA-like permease
MCLQKKLAKLPTPLAGLALGTASIGKLLSIYGYEQNITVSIATTLLIIVLAKFVTNPYLLLQELKHPVLGSIIPTFAMTTMIISSQFPEQFFSQAILLWYTAVAIHLSLLAAFIVLQCGNFKLEDVLPSWFIPPVGLAVAALTCPGAASAELAQYLLYFAISMYFVLLPLMLFRLILLPISNATKPTIAILAAPPNLCLAAYLTFVEQPAIFLVFILLGLALLMSAVVYICLFTLLRLPFTPAFAGFTFPLVISATASIKVCDFLEEHVGDIQAENILNIIATAQLYIAAAMLVYVTIRYVHFFTNTSAVCLWRRGYK